MNKILKTLSMMLLLAMFLSCSVVSNADKKLKIAMIPKAISIGYFQSCEIGAQEAAKELGIELLWAGPTEADASKQIPFINDWIAQKVDVICVSANDPNMLAPIMKKAQAAGIKVITWDADTTKDSRTFLINQATAQDIGYKLMDKMVEEVGNKATIGILTSSFTDSNQNAWIDAIKKRMAEKYPNMKIAAILPSQHDEKIGIKNGKKLVQNNKDLKGIIAPDSIGFPCAAKAVEELGKSGKIAVVGLATPNGVKQYIKSGTVKSCVLWNTVDLGYLTIYAAKELATGQLKAGAKTIEAGRLGTKQIVGDQILLGDPYVFNAANIDNFNF